MNNAEISILHDVASQTHLIHLGGGDFIPSHTSLSSQLLEENHTQSQKDTLLNVITTLPKETYLQPASAFKPIDIVADLITLDSYICLEDWKDPESIIITDEHGIVTEERIYFSAGTVAGKEGKAWSETWQVGMLTRRTGEQSFTLKEPRKILGGKSKEAVFPGGSTIRECAPTVWFDEDRKKICKVMHTDCFSAGDLEYFEADLDEDSPFIYKNTLIEGSGNRVNYDPQKTVITDKHGEKQTVISYVSTPTDERHHILKFSHLSYLNNKAVATDLGIIIDGVDIPYQSRKGDPDSSVLGLTPSYADPEVEWDIEAPWFEENVLDDGSEVIDGYIVTFRKRIGLDENGQLEIRRAGTRQRLTKIRINKTDWFNSIDSANRKMEQTSLQKRDYEPIKVPFEILGYVVDPGKNAECGHGSGRYFQRREVEENNTIGKWKIYELQSESMPHITPDIIFDYAAD